MQQQLAACCLNFTGIGCDQESKISLQAEDPERRAGPRTYIAEAAAQDLSCFFAGLLATIV